MPRDPNDCAECARSYGPHYRGKCEHGGTVYSFDQKDALQFWGARGFTHETTGGNCDAFRFDYEDGRYILVTRAEDPEAPEVTDEPVNVSLYAAADHNETQEAFGADDSEEAASVLADLMERDPAWMPRA